MMGSGSSWRIGLFALSVLFVLQGPVSAEERHTVQSGDSLYKIARHYRISIDSLKKANRLDKDNLKLNQVLVIPLPKDQPAAETARKTTPERTSHYTVQRGDTLAKISKQTGLSIEEIQDLNQLPSDRLKAGQTLTLVRPQTRTEDQEEELGDAAEAPERSTEMESEDKQEASDSLEKWKSPQERSLMVRVVKTFLGVPYRWGGSTFKGMDCSAFVKKIYEIFNIHLPRSTWEQCRVGKKIDKVDLTEGDLVFFRIPTRRASNTHVGIYIGNNEFVHASSRNREVRVDNLDTPYFNKRFMNGVRLKELEREL